MNTSWALKQCSLDQLGMIVILSLSLRHWVLRLHQLVISDLNWGGSSHLKWWGDSLRDISKY